jgi:CRP-like cAMP-binding protein
MELTIEEFDLLTRCSLFHGIEKEKLKEMLSCLHARRETFAPGDFLLREGDRAQEVGLVLSGRGRSLIEDSLGEPVVLSLLSPGSLMGVFLAASRDHKSPVSIQAQEELTALFFPGDALSSPCSNNCPEHGVLVRNYLSSLAEKSLVLNSRISCLARRTVREKVLAYLTQTALQKGVDSPGEEFSVPLDRSAMATYLNIDRTALSRELSRMKQEGLIDFHKDRFRLLKGSGTR